LNPVEIKKGIYWVGAVDWSLRSFHGYSITRGTTYNAYLIVDKKIALIDTVKAEFADEMISRIEKIVDPSKIDYIISNHVEMDHSGSLPRIMELAPNAVVFSSQSGAKGLTAHYGDLGFTPVATGAALELGERTLSFVTTPMLHWPDNMFTYCRQDKLLFSNDAFGQHYASPGRFEDEESLEDVFAEARSYYANIVMPYGAQVKAALDVAAKLDIEIIAPSHGVIWRSNIPEILTRYRKWSSNETERSAVVVFDSMWHSTEKIAQTICEAFTDKGVHARLLDLKFNERSDIMSQILTAEYIAVGSSTLNNNLLPNVAAFLSYLRGLAPKGRKALAFGSYGWSGQSVGLVEEQLIACGFDIIMDKIRVQYVPAQEQLDNISNELKSKL
jgi:flavorubredoxin